MNSELNVFLINGILGVPLFIFSLFYFKLRANFFKKDTMNDVLYIKRVFTPALIQNDNKEASRINTYTKWFWLFCLLYGIIVALVTEYFIFK